MPACEADRSTLTPQIAAILTAHTAVHLLEAGADVVTISHSWGDVLYEHDLAAVVLARALERGEHIVLGGRSWRTKHIDPETLGDVGADSESVRNVT